MGDPRARAAADLEPGPGGADRRCLPPDDTLYGAGRGHLDRGCRRAGALPQGRAGRRHRSGVQALRGAPQAAHLENPGDFQRQHLDERRQRRSELALWLRCLEYLARRAGPDTGRDADGRGMSGSLTASAGNFLAPDGCPIAYTLHSASPQGGSRSRIALVHSLALDRSVWDGVVPLLTPHSDVLTYDCRGHGQSGRPKMKFTPELFAV